MRARVLSAVLAGVVALTAVFWSGPLPIALLLALAVAIGTAELLALLGMWGYPLAGLCTGIIYGINQPVLFPSGWIAVAIGSTLQILGVATLLLRRGPEWMESVQRFLGLAYVISPFVAAFGIHRLGATVPEGWNFASPLLVLLVPVWAGDTAAMLVGRKFGKHLLAPKISPKKTVEGAIANLLAATVGGLAVAAPLGLPIVVGGLAGLVCGTLGQVGALFESSLKRRADVKDSGSILPGHGGLLDRVDALLFCAWPVFAILLAFG